MSKKNQCFKCQAMCCRYVALPIETPETRGDFDDIRWYLCHKNVSVFVEDGDWYINFKTDCRNRSPKDHKCLIYEKRPRICKKYKTDNCDLMEGEYDYDLHFTDDKQMTEYIKIKFENNIKEKPKVKGAKSVKGKKGKKAAKGKK